MLTNFEKDTQYLESLPIIQINILKEIITEMHQNDEGWP